MKKNLVVSTIFIIFSSIVTLGFSHFNDLSCANRSIFNSRDCQKMEQEILNSTIRVQIENWVVLPGEKGYDIQSSIGHATVMNGRYLVTHSHFKLPLNLGEQTEDWESYNVVYLFNSKGEQVHKGPLSDFELIGDDAETMIIAHKEDGFFETLGFVSANFQSWSDLSLATGMTVAQIDWDGVNTRVDWAIVQEVILEEGTPRLVLTDEVLIGASGGGVFWNGTHVANIWRIEEQIDPAGAVIGAVTTVALNPAGMFNQ